MKITNTKRRISGANTYMECLQYNEKKTKRKEYCFWPTPTLRPMPKFYESTQPTLPTSKF